MVEGRDWIWPCSSLRPFPPPQHTSCLGKMIFFQGWYSWECVTGNQLQFRAILARAQPAGKKHFFSSVSTCATSSLVCLIRHQDTGANPAEGHQSCWVLGRVTSEERLGDQGAAPCGEEQVQGCYGHYLLNGRGWRRCSQLSWKVHKGSVRGSRCRLQQDRFQLDTRGSKGWMSLWGWSNFGTGSDKKMMSLSPPILSQLDAALSNIV